MRCEIPGRGFDDFRELAELGRDGQFVRVVEQSEVGLLQRLVLAVPLRENGADAGMGVLDVVDRVLVGLALGEIEVESYNFV